MDENMLYLETDLSLSEDEKYTKCPKMYTNLYCVCLDALQICGKFWDTQYICN